MLRVAFLLFTIVSTVLMGSFLVVALGMGYDTAKPVIIAVLLGFVCAMPISWLIANKLNQMRALK
jgi:predicted PurR-regulated permease PerM